MLLGEQRGGRENRHLLAVGDGDKGGAQRDFGLAKTDVAANEPVHGLAGAHVGDDGIDGGELVRRFLKAEALAKGLDVMGLDVKGVALARGAYGVQVQQFGGSVAHLGRGFFLGFFPLLAAQLVQGRGLGQAAGVAADDVQLRHRHIELVLAGVFKQQELGLAFAKIKVEQALVAAYAVLGVHHRIADLELGQVAQHVLDRALARLVAQAARARGAGVELGLGDDAPALGLDRKAVEQRAD